MYSVYRSRELGFLIMKFYLKIVVVFFSIQCSFSQETSSTAVDSLYKEDQFYVGISYNILGKQPDGLSQSGFSTGLHFGFIKDMPLNTKRNVAIGIGLGYSINSYNQNMQIQELSDGSYGYSIVDGGTYSKNRFASHLIELPIEFRWRTSTPTEFKFWRIYTGFKIGYNVFNASKFNGDSGTFKHTKIDDFNKVEYGLTLSAGYNTWNIYFYYGLNPIFSDNAVLDDEVINMNAIKVGLMFYIL